MTTLENVVLDTESENKPEVRDPAPGRPGPRWDAMDLMRRLSSSRIGGITAALLALIVLGVAWSPRFASTSNASVIFESMAQAGIMSVGMTFVIITAEIDLSIGSIYALTGVVTGSLMQAGWPLALAILVGLAIGAAAGLINGLATVLLKLPSFIVTLGTLSVFEGLALLLVNGNPVTLSSGTKGEKTLNSLTQPVLAGIFPAQFVVFVVILVLGAILLRYTLFGYHVYATGGSPSAARLCGISTRRVKTVAFVLSGLSAAIAGILGLGFLDYIEGDSSQGIELTVIAAVIIGGTALFGGSGTMLGTLVGVLFLNVLQDILNLKAVSSFIETVITGAIIVIAVALDTVGILHKRRT